MNLLISAAICLLLLELLRLVDKRVKGNFSIVVKVISLIIITIFISGFIFLYGQSVLESIQVDVKSFTNLKSFFSSRVFGALAILIYLLLFLKTFYIIFRFVTKRTFKREEKAIILLSIVFDIAVIPNIVKAGFFNVVLVVPAILSLLETGLALTNKLVFSIYLKEKNREVLA